jgi:hypothetical protein
MIAVTSESRKGTTAGAKAPTKFKQRNKLTVSTKSSNRTSSNKPINRSISTKSVNQLGSIKQDNLTSQNKKPNIQKNAVTKDQRPDNKPNSIPVNKPNSIPGNKPNGIPDDKPNSIPDNKPNSIPVNKPNSIPGNKPNGIPGNKPNGIPDDKLNGIPDDKPNSIPGNKLNGIPDDKKNGIPDDKKNGKNKDDNETEGKQNGAPDNQQNGTPDDKKNGKNKDDNETEGEQNGEVSDKKNGQTDGVADDDVDNNLNKNNIDNDSAPSGDTDDENSSPMSSFDNSGTGSYNPGSSSFSPQSTTYNSSDQDNVQTSNGTTVFEIVTFISILIEGLTTFVPYIVYFIFIFVTALAILNVLLYLGVVILHFIRSSSDTVYKDTLKYKLFTYADIFAKYKTDVNFFYEQKASEPFLIFVINYWLIIIIFIYILLGLIVLVCVLILKIFKLVIPIIMPQLNMQSLKDVSPFKTLQKFEIYLGLLIVVFLFMFYQMYFNFVHDKMNSTKEELSKVDAAIKDSLTSLSPNVSTEMYEILKNKKKGNANGEYEQINDLIVKDLAAGNKNLATQKLLLAMYYSHIQDNIPDTNQDALESINQYFFKTTDGTSSIKSQKECKNLTFVSLMVEADGVSTLSKFYKNLDIYKKRASPEIKNMLKDVDKIIIQVNENLTTVSSKLDDNSVIFGIYIFLTALYCVVALMLFNFVITVSAKRKDKPEVAVFASFINTIMVTLIPSLSEFYLRALYSQSYEACKFKFKNDNIGFTDCVINSASGSNSLAAPSNEMAAMA